MLKALLIALDHAPDEPKGRDNPYGTGHMLHVGFEIKCAGTPDDSGEILSDSRHLIGTMTTVPDEGVDCCPTERADECTFVLAQPSFDVNNPVCTICGQPATL